MRIASTNTTLRTNRLDLVPLAVEAIEALLAGEAAAASRLVGVALRDDLGSTSQPLLLLRLANLRAAPGAEAWLLRVIARRSGERHMVGLTGFHGPPDITGTAEVGYEIDPAHRHNGYATEAAAVLVDWALTIGGARRVVAAIRPDNGPSLAVIRRLGFAAAGSRWDALDGTALLFERRAHPALPTRLTTGDGAKMRGEQAR